jgi:hypothetical protein
MDKNSIPANFPQHAPTAVGWVTYRAIPEPEVGARAGRALVDWSWGAAGESLFVFGVGSGMLWGPGKWSRMGPCTRLLDYIHVGILSPGELQDVKREGLRLTVMQNGVEYRFKIRAMGDDLLHDGSKNGSDPQNSSQ